MNKLLVFGTAALLALATASCDDGHINDPIRTDSGDSYTVQVVGNFSAANSWTGKYSVAAACFDDDSPYSLTQAPLPSNTDGEAQVLTLTNVPTQTKTVEIALVTSLRERIATLYSYEIPADQRLSDTIKVNVGDINVGMFSTINKVVFQGQLTSCARCHSGSSAAASLDLSAENAYANLVGVQATKDPTQTRVVAGNATQSYLYKVITEGDPNVGYSHPALFTNEGTAPFADIIRDWINSGAKE